MLSKTALYIGSAVASLSLATLAFGQNGQATDSNESLRQAISVLQANMALLQEEVVQLTTQQNYIVRDLSGFESIVGSEEVSGIKRRVQDIQAQLTGLPDVESTASLENLIKANEASIEASRALIAQIITGQIIQISEAPSTDTCSSITVKLAADALQHVVLSGWVSQSEQLDAVLNLPVLANKTISNNVQIGEGGCAQQFGTYQLLMENNSENPRRYSYSDATRALETLPNGVLSVCQDMADSVGGFLSDGEAAQMLWVAKDIGGRKRLAGCFLPSDGNVYVLSDRQDLEQGFILVERGDN